MKTIALLLALLIASCADVPEVDEPELSVTYQESLAVVWPDTLWMPVHVRSTTNATWQVTTWGWAFVWTDDYRVGAYSWQSATGPSLTTTSNASTCSIGCVGGVCGKWICGSTVYTCPSVDFGVPAGQVYYGPNNGVYQTGWYPWPSPSPWSIPSPEVLSGSALSKTGAPGNWQLTCGYPKPAKWLEMVRN